jgi:general secretion pathway protein E
MIAALGSNDWMTPFLADLPRGEIYFFSTLRIVVVLAVFFIWLRTLVWIDKDANWAGLPREFWTLSSLASFIASMFVLFLFPYFGYALWLVTLLYGWSTFAYIWQRNRKVPPQLRVFTQQHLARLFGKRPAAPKEAASSTQANVPEAGKLFVRGVENKEPNAGDAEGEKLVGIPIRFLSRRREDDELQESSIEKSPGLKSAVELLWEALAARATDIHLEPARDEMTVRLRIDSIMTPAVPFTLQRGTAVVNIFKNLAGLDITEKRKPQDGSFTAAVETRNVDFRVATAGSVNGEKLVIRILDSTRQMKGLAETGLRESMRASIQEMIACSSGMLLTCGPTGAGKTSTLYSCLNEIDRHHRNVITLENPVEYHLENITQIEILDKAGKTFANELRSVLRQDPDVILIGEIRDAETAEIACQSAQTGHFVLSTIHANDAVTALTRLLDLGVKPYMVASALTGILGQRLVRLLCPRCKVPHEPSPDLLDKFKVPPGRIKVIYRAADASDRPTDKEGKRLVCAHCRGTGYSGRTGIFELLIMNDEIRSHLRQATLDVTALKQAAVKSGLIGLFDEGQKKVLEGKTSLAEIHRVAK